MVYLATTLANDANDDLFVIPSEASLKSHIEVAVR